MTQTTKVIAPILPNKIDKINVFGNSSVIYDGREMPISTHIATSTGHNDIQDVRNSILKSEPELANKFDTLWLAGKDMELAELMQSV